MTETAAASEREALVDRLGEIADRFERLLTDCAPVLSPPALKEESVSQMLGEKDSLASCILVRLEPLLSFIEAEIVPVIKDTPAEHLREHMTRKRAPGGKFKKQEEH